ncbi:MAG: hypothetical protein R3F15_18545 [Lysobacterales bacterium]
MELLDGQSLRAGDWLRSGDGWSGRILAIIDTADFVPELVGAHWSYLGTGVLIDTDFAGMVHFQHQDLLNERVERCNAPAVNEPMGRPKG